MTEVPTPMKDLAELLTAVAALLWPLLVVIALMVLLPKVLNLVRTARTFKIKIGDYELTLEQFVDQVQRAIGDVEIETAGKPMKPKRILWVDDHPENNALIAAKLKARGMIVVEALSTADARTFLSSGPFDLAITDLERWENGRNNQLAGIDFIKAASQDKPGLPVYVFTSENALKKHAPTIRGANPAGATASTVELLRYILS